MPRWTNNTMIASDNTWTSELTIQAHKRGNVCLWIGSIDASYVSVNASQMSAIIWLQRKLPGDDVWRVVQEWVIVVGDGQEGNIESVTTQPEPETCIYRLGCALGQYESGTAYARLGTM